MTETKDTIYMERCLQLAAMGAGNVAPNPMVGAVLVYRDTIIGEGFHQKYGEAHAEVNCINSVKPGDLDKIPKATLFVSLEPCAHFGKTPPCANLIISHKIPQVVIACSDPFDRVNGRGVKKLRDAGIAVKEGVLEEKARLLNKRFFTFHRKKRPYVILKWAQTANGVIGAVGNEARLLISNEFSNRLVHKWRSAEAAIMIGAQTALKDDPLLDNRHWFGNPPLKVVISARNTLSPGLRALQSGSATWVFNTLEEKTDGASHYIKVNADNVLSDVVHYLYENNVQSVLVEGGRQLLQAFIDKNIWDEARVITNKALIIDDGIIAPVLHHETVRARDQHFSDEIVTYKNSRTTFNG